VQQQSPCYGGADTVDIGHPCMDRYGVCLRVQCKHFVQRLQGQEIVGAICYFVEAMARSQPFNLCCFLTYFRTSSSELGGVQTVRYCIRDYPPSSTVCP